MTHVMAKGANISLAVAAVRLVLRWGGAPGGPDVDASGLLLGVDGRVRSDADFVFYNQPRHPSGLVRHLPKQRLTESDEIADSIEVDLAKLPAEIDRVVLAGSAEEGSFRAVRGLRVLLYDAAPTAAGAAPLAEFPVADVEEVSALVCGELYRRAGSWKFRAVGQGYASGLGGLATDFGIAVDDDEPAAPAVPAPAAPARAPREEPGTYPLAPAVPASAAAATPPPVPTPAAAAAAPTIAAPPRPTAPPTLPPPSAPPGYGYPQQPTTTGYPAPPQPAYGYPPTAPPPPGYGYPPQQPGYGYPPQPAPQTVPLPPPDPTFVLPPQGPQFQSR
ncbi:TerD family protein [Kitasatospora sp. NPDC052896]|uniref:TerD family protein n=1 Tax=Kitasatospora sp. NPDC052896 TaxID=3364061 RepID=UPI0037CB86DF